jgi:hypothetical protein
MPSELAWRAAYVAPPFLADFFAVDVVCVFRGFGCPFSLRLFGAVAERRVPASGGGHAIDPDQASGSSLESISSRRAAAIQLQDRFEPALEDFLLHAVFLVFAAAKLA